MRRCLLPLLLPLCTCSGLQPVSTYAGPVAPQAGTCDPASQGVLTLRQQNLVFAPNSGTLVLTGKASNDALSATLTLTGADKKPYDLAFQGTRHGKQISGTYLTPRCRYSVSLKRTSD